MPFELKPIQVSRTLSSTYDSNISINPYQGCVFACGFCSAIRMNYFTGKITRKWDKTFYRNRQGLRKRSFYAN